ncbi:DUF6452 family protein [Salegentibacter chungangensis]|uniref:DUF6452 family protein n=1 Tax=Salegentibacter chungangensis TaxID=1335724 RepID=A0ABW3NT74_9FLAO
MKNLSIKFLAASFSLLSLMGCQKDDICPESTQTTPLLVLRFYDAQERDNAQAPINLSVREINNDTTWLYRVNRDSIVIPLRTDADQTQYEFILNDQESDTIPDQSIETNTDLLTFSYAREQEYINRACSFKINYLDLKLQVDGEEDGEWIQDIFIEQTEVTDEASAHISLYY